MLRIALVFVAVAFSQTPEADVREFQALLQRGKELQGNGQHQDSLRYFERALRKGERMGPMSESIAWEWVGTSYFELRRLAESERAFVRCLELRDKVWGVGNGRNHNYARILTSLWGVELLLGRYRQAEERFDMAISIWRSIPQGEKDGNFAANLNNIGMLCFKQGRYADAARWLREVVALFQDSFPADDQRLASARGNLAAALSHLGLHDEADRLSSQALADFNGKLDQEPQLAAELLSIRVVVLRKAKRGREAKAVEARAREFLRKAGAHHRVDVSAFAPRSR